MFYHWANSRKISVVKTLNIKNYGKTEKIRKHLSED